MGFSQNKHKDLHLNIKKLLRNCISDFKKSFHLNIKYEIIHKIITFFALVPFLSIIINHIIWISDKEDIVNIILLKFSTSTAGVITTIFLGIISLISILIEFKVLTFVSENIYWGNNINLSQAFYAAFKKFPDDLKKKKKLSGENFLLLFKILSCFYTLLIICICILILILKLILKILMWKIGSNSFLVLTMLSFFPIILSIILIITSMFSVPFNVILLTRFYHDLLINQHNIKINYLIDKNFDSTFSLKNLKYNKPFKLMVIFTISLFVSSVFLTAYYSNVEMKNVFITAHRGNPIYTPENTLSGIKYAIDVRADYAEIDVQETKDGKLVLLHDTNLKRVAGVNKNIWDVNHRELNKYDLSKKFTKKTVRNIKGEKVPTLEEVIKICKGKIKLNIELKVNGHDKDLVEKVVDLIHRENFTDQCVISSVNYEALQKVRKLDPKIKIGNIIYILVGDITEIDVDFYSLEKDNITDKLVRKTHLMGRELHVWTVNNKKDMKKLMNLGVDNIITDYPRDLKKIKERNKLNRKVAAIKRKFINFYK